LYVLYVTLLRDSNTNLELNFGMNFGMLY